MPTRAAHRHCGSSERRIIGFGAAAGSSFASAAFSGPDGGRCAIRAIYQPNT